jgi:hypothetical protein
VKVKKCFGLLRYIKSGLKAIQYTIKEYWKKETKKLTYRELMIRNFSFGNRQTLDLLHGEGQRDRSLVLQNTRNYLWGKAPIRLKRHSRQVPVPLSVPLSVKARLKRRCIW